VNRNVALDAYRGWVMLLMMAEVLHLSKVAAAFPGNAVWGFLAYHQSHVEWAGCSLHDMIQPSFSFLVGAALPYSLAARLAKGDTAGKLFGHALWRSFLLAALGIFLRSINRPVTNFTFEDTLTQIGLGYPFLFLLGFVKPPKWAWAALGVILAGYWLAWVTFPVAEPWAKNNNLGHFFDVWFLNLFPRVSPFTANRGGYLTLSFIPTLGTMVLGLIAGRWLREGAELQRFLVAAGAAAGAGLLLHFTGVCPIVKRIWTPAWVLFSGGLCFLLLAAFQWVIETKGYRKWAFPLIVTGTNSIAAYLIAHLFDGFVVSSLKTHLGEHFFAFLHPGLEPLFQGAAVLLAFWLILYWMYNRKLFLKV
jgi:predicted acyltransferase